MALRQLSIHADDRNAVTELRSAIAPYLNGERSLPDHLFTSDGTWRWASIGQERHPEITSLWTDQTDIDVALLAIKWMDRLRGLIPPAIYVISADDGASKIGVSSSPLMRLRSLQSASPRQLAIKALIWGSENPRSIERSSLNLAASRGQRVSGEWVATDPSEAVQLILEAGSDRAAKITPARGMLISLLSSLLPAYRAARSQGSYSRDAIGAFVDAEMIGHQRGRGFGVVR